MGAVAGLADAYTRDAAFLRNLGDTDVQRVVALRASAPATPELHATMNDLTTALREASVAVTHVYSLLGHDGAEDVCELTAAISEVARLVRIVIERIADFRLELPDDEPLHVAMSRAAIVQGVSGLLTAALRAVRDREERGTITLRVEPRADVAIVEVIDNGAGMSPYVLEQALEPEFAQNPAAPPGLAEIADRIRSAGGELVLESQQGVGTTVRIFVPMLPRHEQPKPQVS
jgi:signal transduction histidine kinase